MTRTPTRLTVRANGDANSYALLDDKGHWFMSLLVNGEQLEAKQEANLRRLAACWNACTGMATDQVDAMNVQRMLTALGELQANPNDPRAHRSALDVLACQ